MYQHAIDMFITTEKYAGEQKQYNAYWMRIFCACCGCCLAKNPMHAVSAEVEFIKNSEVSCTLYRSHCNPICARAMKAVIYSVPTNAIILPFAFKSLIYADLSSGSMFP